MDISPVLAVEVIISPCMSLTSALAVGSEYFTLTFVGLASDRPICSVVSAELTSAKASDELSDKVGLTLSSSLSLVKLFLDSFSFMSLCGVCSAFWGNWEDTFFAPSISSNLGTLNSTSKPLKTSPSVGNMNLEDVLTPCVCFCCGSKMTSRAFTAVFSSPHFPTWESNSGKATSLFISTFVTSTLRDCIFTSGPLTLGCAIPKFSSMFTSCPFISTVSGSADKSASFKLISGPLTSVPIEDMSTVSFRTLTPNFGNFTEGSFNFVCELDIVGSFCLATSTDSIMSVVASSILVLSSGKETSAVWRLRSLAGALLSDLLNLGKDNLGLFIFTSESLESTSGRSAFISTVTLCTSTSGGCTSTFAFGTEISISALPELTSIFGPFTSGRLIPNFGNLNIL
ncbi:hypothetical protein PDJAM_G00186750, partial [Pangasius djambal]|nr:hypothetical protein [Pangasius djambal]